MGTRRWWKQALAVGMGLAGIAMMTSGGLRVNVSEASAVVDCDVADYSNDGQEMAFLSLVNSYRSQNGQGPLALNDTLNRTAAWMVNDMGTNNYFSHTDSLGRSAYKRAVDCGYAGGAGENLAGGSAWDTAQEAFDAWKASAGHNANMLGGYYTEIGIARTNAPGSSYGWYWATEFGAGSSGGGSAATSTPANSATATKTPTKTPTPTAAALATSTPTPTASAAAPTSTPTATGTTPAAATATPTKTATATPTMAASPTPAGSGSTGIATPTKTPQAKSTPTRTPIGVPSVTVTPSPARASLALRPGANLVAWPGEDMATAQAIKSAGTSVSMVYRWDAASKRWQRYSASLPGFANTLTTMHKGEAYWVISTGQTQVYVP